MRKQIIGSGNSIADKIPAILPLTKAVTVVDEVKTKVNLDKNYTQATGFASTIGAQPEDWGAQIFRETVLKQYLVDQEEE